MVVFLHFYTGLCADWFYYLFRQGKVWLKLGINWLKAITSISGVGFCLSHSKYIYTLDKVSLRFKGQINIRRYKPIIIFNSLQMETPLWCIAQYSVWNSFPHRLISNIRCRIFEKKNREKMKSFPTFWKLFQKDCYVNL